MEPTADLAYIREVMARTERRVDPHAGHFVLWGALVLVCYPAMNALCIAGHSSWSGILGIAALIVGSFGSGLFEFRLKRNPRLEGENTHIGSQIVWIVYANLGAALLIGSAGPPLGWIPPQATPIVWGLAYANLTFMLGVVYRGEYRVAGACILAASIAAMVWMRYSGYILGPVMGLGMIIPGVMAERRVARLARES